MSAGSEVPAGNTRAGDTATVHAYAPRTALRWLAEATDVRHRQIEGTLVFADVSGFTRLSERLTARGRAGAEEVVGLIGGVLTALVEQVEARGGDVLVFAGDALVVLFEGEAAPARATRTAAAFRHWFAGNGSVATSVGRVALRVSTGIASGGVDLVLAGTEDQRGVFVVGPTVTRMAELESAASAGEILVDNATAAEIDRRWLGAERGGGRLVRRTTPLESVPRESVEQLTRPSSHADSFLPPPVRRFVVGGDRLEGEHRIATIAFVRAGGLDEPLATGGAAAVSAVSDLDALFRAASEAATRHGVTLLGTDVAARGATLFLVAGAPTATGEDEERMLHALREILATPVADRLQLRAGVNRGPVFAGDVGAPGRRTYTAMGDTTNLAARLSARARPGELVATAQVVARSATSFATEALEPFVPKGKRLAVVPYRVGSPTGRRETESTALPIVGRAEELATLRSALGRVAGGRNELVEIVGEAGVGKSRLVQELLAGAPEAARLVVRFASAGASSPYAALQGPLRAVAGIPPDATADDAGQALAVVVDGLALPGIEPWLPLVALPFGAPLPPTPEIEALAPAFRRTRLHEAVNQVLGRVLGVPAIVVLEDVHWADEATLALFAAFMQPGAGVGRLVVALRRPGEDPFPGLTTTRIELDTLPPDAVGSLALAAAGSAPMSDATLAAIVRRAAGNPLFARELAAAAAASGSAADLPDRLETLLASRIDRLDASGRGLLRRAAVVGRTVELDLLAEIAGTDVGDVRDLARWAPLGEFVDWVSDETVRFRHDLLRDAAYEGLSHARRIELHGRLADAIAQRAGDATEDVAAVLALHYSRGGRPALAFEFGRRAGDLARAQYANVDAAELYERALAAGAQVDGLAAGKLAGVAESLGDVAELAGRYDEARRAYARARALDRRDDGVSSGDRLRAARLARKTGIVCERAGRYVEALSWYTKGLATLPAGDPGGPSGPDSVDALRIRLTLDMAGIRMRQGKYSACVRTALPAAEMAERTGQRALLAHAYYLLHAAYGDLGSPEVARYRDLALPIYEELGDLVGQGNVLNNLGIEAYFEGRWEDALGLYRRSKDAKSRAGDVANAATQSNNEAEILSDQGRHDEAGTLLRDALRVWSSAGYEIGVALATSNLGRAAARAGRHGDALGLLREAATRFERIGAHGYVDETRARIAECLAFAGRADEAENEATATLERVHREAETSVLGAQLERILGWAAQRRGDSVAAREHFSSSLRQARGLGATFELALTARAAADAGVEPEPDWPDGAEVDAILRSLGVRSVAAFA